MRHDKLSLPLLILATLLAFGSLGGCVQNGLPPEGADNPGGSGNTPPSGTPTTPANQSAAGIWRGTVTAQSGATFQSVGLVSQAGDLRLITTGSNQISGNITVTGAAFSANLRSYVPAAVVITSVPPIHGSASGTVNQTSALLGNIALNDSTTSSLTYTYDPLYERDSSLAAISGNYSKTSAGYTVTFSIDAAGVFTGSDTNGCVMNGNVELLNTNFNMYKLNVTVTNCDEANGPYLGLAALSDVVTANDTLLFSMECVALEDLISGQIKRM